MIIDKVDLWGFGRLCDRSFTFSPTLNVVIGLNEAGKSTLLEAIQALLYGQFRDSAAWAGEAANKRYRPWSGAVYGGSVHLHLAHGERYQIERRFDDEHTTVFGDPNATDVTASYGPGPHGWVDFADQHLGLTPAVFRACAYIHQNDLAPDRDDVKLLHARLRSLADSGGTEKSAQDAMSTLDTWLNNRVIVNAPGTENNPLEQTNATVHDLQDRLRKSRDALEELASLVADGLRCAAEEARIRCALGRLDQLIAWLEVKDLEAQLPLLADIERELADLRNEIRCFAGVAAGSDPARDQPRGAFGNVGWPSEAGESETGPGRRNDDDRARIARNLAGLSEELNQLPPPHRASLADLDAAQSAFETWERAANDVRGTTERYASIQNQRKEARAHRDARLNRLPYVTVDALRRAVDNAADRLRDLELAMQRSAEHPSESDVSEEYHTLQVQLRTLGADELKRMHALEADLTADKAQQKTKSTPPIRLVVAIGALVGLIVGYVLFTAIGAAIGTIAIGVVAYGAASLLGGRRVTEGISPTSHVLLDKWLAEYSVRSVDELQQRWDHCAQLGEQIVAARRLQEELELAQRASTSALDELEGVAGSRDVADAKLSLALLEAWVSEQVILDRTEAEARDVVKRARRDLSEAQPLARTALERLDLVAEDPSHALSLLADLRATRERRLALFQRHAELQAKVDQYENTSAALDERLPRAARPDAGDTRTLDDLRTEAQLLASQLEDTRTRLAQLATRRKKRLQGLTDPAEIEEQLGDATASLARLQYRANVLQAARSIIKTVGEEHRRNFAPRLAESVSSWLDRATNQRYAHAEVSPADLSVRLESHERGGLVSLDQVSRGTRDALALLFRANVADLLSDTSEPVPLFLDDPLVHVDPERTRGIIDILYDLAQYRQIFYCTQDPRIVEWVTQRGDGCIQSLTPAAS